MIASQSSSSSGTGILGTRSLVSYTLVALAWGLAAYSHPAMAAPRSLWNPAHLSVEDAEAPLSRPPWDPQGCQTIVFFHIPKTAGTPVLLAAKGLKLWRKGYSLTSLRRTGVSWKTQAKNLISIKPWSQESPKLRHRFVELHCGDAISFMEARETLKAMRTEHEENDCGFFAFTVIRSPLDWLFSKYNYSCYKYIEPSCPQKVSHEKMPLTEQMLAFPHRDGQVSYLTDGICQWASNGPVDESTVNEVVSSLTSHLDHVALTEEVPELRKYLTKRFAAPGGVLTPEVEDYLDSGATKSNNIKVVQVGDFNPEKLEQLNSTIQQDWKLYERVLADHKPVSVDDIVSTPNGDRKR
ncbi:unnamed protein product [Pylaiella littoralis]